MNANIHAFLQIMKAMDSGTKYIALVDQRPVKWNTQCTAEKSLADSAPVLCGTWNWEKPSGEVSEIHPWCCQWDQTLHKSLSSRTSFPVHLDFLLSHQIALLAIHVHGAKSNRRVGLDQDRQGWKEVWAYNLCSYGINCRSLQLVSHVHYTPIITYHQSSKVNEYQWEPF